MDCFYRMKENGGPMVKIDHAVDAPSWNKKGYGIFWSIQEFDGARRKENLTYLNGFAIDIDSGAKEEQLELIKTNIWPTWVIETKRGFHLYWLFHEPQEVRFTEELELQYKGTLKKLIWFYGADENAADICRVLRAPYFYHLKEPSDPFMVKVKAENPIRYDWRRIDDFFQLPPPEKESKVPKTFLHKKLGTNKGSVFELLADMNAKDGLEKLSGHHGVSGEVYSFRQCMNGNQNIYVNKKSTSCWIDKDGKIGSLDKGGPTIWQWLYWYHRDHKKVYEIVKEVFSEFVSR